MNPTLLIATTEPVTLHFANGPAINPWSTPIPVNSDTSGVSADPVNSTNSTNPPQPTMSSAPEMVKTMTELLHAQSKVMTAQAKAVAMKKVPPLPLYSSKGVDIKDDG